MRRNFRRTALSLIIFTLFLAGMMLPAGRAEIIAEETMPKSPVVEKAFFDGSKVRSTWDCVYFGNCEQADPYNDYSPIKWLVLDVADNGDALLLSDRILYSSYYVESTSEDYSTWATSILRTTLANRSKYWFSDEERNDILTTHLVTEDNPEYGTDGGADTDDKLFCLSIKEATNPKYGFSPTYGSDETRFCLTTPAVKSYGREYFGIIPTDGVWYLRNSGEENYSSTSGTIMHYYHFANVGDNTFAGREGAISTHGSWDRLGIRPALRINLKKSKNWKYAGKETKGTKASTINLPNTTVTLDKGSYEYTGKKIKPPVTVEYNGSALKLGTDYTVSYSENLDVGTATMILTGIGFFNGTQEVTFSITDTTKPFLKKNGKYYYTGTEPATGKTYNLGAELVIDRDITIPPGTKVTAKKITIKKGSGTKLGWVTMLSGSSLISKGTMSVSGHLDMATGSTLTASDKITIDDGIVSQSGNSKFKSKKAISIKGSAIYELREKSQLTAGTTLSIGGSAKFNMSGNATVDTAKFSYSSSKSGSITGGTIKASGDVTLGKKFNSTGTNVLRMDGSDKQKLTLPKGSKVICLSFEDRSLNKVTIGGSGQVKKLIVNPRKLGLSEKLEENDYHQYFSISKVPAHDSGIDRAIETALYLKLTGKKLGVNDLLKDFYSSMKGKARFASNKFRIPVIVKLKRGGYERGHISCDGFSFNTIGAWDVVYESGNKKYRLAVTTSLFSNQKAVDKFMKGLSKDGSEEIKSEVRDFIEGSLLAAFGEISDACSFEKGRFAVDLLDGSKMATEYWSMLTKMNKVNNKLK